MKSAEDILALYKERYDGMGDDFARMDMVSTVIDGDIVVALPEMNSNEKAAVPNVAQQGLDQLAKRISSVVPNVVFPPLSATKAGDKRSNERGKVIQGWWAENRMRKKLGRRSRWYLGYATAPVVIKPGPAGIPTWTPRHPRDTFPSDVDIDEYTPADTITRSIHTYQWLVDHYPIEAGRIQKPATWDVEDPRHKNTTFIIVEYNDSDEDTLVLCGYDREEYHPVDAIGSPAEILAQVPNRANIPWHVIPGRITLNKRIGHFDGILGMYQTMAEIRALQIISARRSLWPREWLVANPGETPKIISIPDPAQGRPGRLQGGRLEQQQIDPAFQVVQPLVQQLDEAQRSTAGIPTELGGRAGTGTYTGARGRQVLGAAIDFTIEEANQIFAESLYEEDRRAIAIDKAYFGAKKTYHVITRGFQGEITYTANKLWESDKHVVDYPFAGVDLQNLPVEGGQRVAMETLSQETFMEMDPAVADVPGEKQRIWIQKARRAWFASFEQQASAPESPYRPEDVGKIIQYIKSGLDPEDALQKWETELQELQAQAQEGQLPPEQMQPGLSPQGAPGELPAAIPEAEPSLQNMQGLLSRMATTQTAQKYR